MSSPRSHRGCPGHPSRALVAGPGVFVGLVAGALVGFVAGAPAHALSTLDPVAIRGTVTDAGGHPLAGARVVLEASRKSLRSSENEVRRVVATTDAQGSYSMTWPWDPYFNRFQVEAGVAIRQGKEERFEVFERQSVSARSMETGAVVLPLVVRDAERFAKLRSFEQQVKTEDERRVFAELGQPEEVRVVEYPDRREVTWWYFESGRAYRFESGRLVQVIPFDPIRKF